jgi:hypothetical protein
MVATKKLVAYVLVIMFAIIFTAVLYSPSGAFEKGKSAVEGVKELVPNVSIGDSGLVGGTPEISSLHSKEILTLNTTINKMLSSSDNDCFGNYGGFTSLGKGDGAVTITMSYDSEKGGTQFAVNGGKGGKQIIRPLNFFVPKMRPCVIASNAVLVQNFFENFVNGKNNGNYYAYANSITIRYDEGTGTGATCSNGNRITVPEFGTGGPNKYCNNFEDQGVIFTPDNLHICFFPTNAVKNADKHGIDNNFVWSFKNKKQCS